MQSKIHLGLFLGLLFLAIGGLSAQEDLVKPLPIKAVGDTLRAPELPELLGKPDSVDSGSGQTEGSTRQIEML